MEAVAACLRPIHRAVPRAGLRLRAAGERVPPAANLRIQRPPFSNLYRSARGPEPDPDAQLCKRLHDRGDPVAAAPDLRRPPRLPALSARSVVDAVRRNPRS